MTLKEKRYMNMLRLVSVMEKLAQLIGLMATRMGAHFCLTLAGRTQRWSNGNASVKPSWCCQPPIAVIHATTWDALFVQHGVNLFAITVLSGVRMNRGP